MSRRLAGLLVPLLLLSVTALAGILPGSVITQAKNGEPAALIAVEKSLLYSGDKADSRQALEIFQQAAKKGSALAEKIMGDIYRKGVGTGKDLKKSFEYYVKAARKREPSAQLALADAYHHGIGTDVNVISAYVWAMLGSKGQENTMQQEIAANLTPAQLEKARELVRQIDELYLND